MAGLGLTTNPLHAFFVIRSWCSKQARALLFNFLARCDKGVFQRVVDTEAIDEAKIGAKQGFGHASSMNDISSSDIGESIRLFMTLELKSPRSDSPFGF